MIGSNGSTEVSVKPVIGGLASVVRSLTAVCLASAQALVFGFRLFGTAAHGKLLKSPAITVSLFPSLQILVLYPESQNTLCIVRLWFRHIGFGLGFTSLLLKTWR